MLAQDAAPVPDVSPDFPVAFLIAAVVLLIVFLVTALIAFTFVRDWARGFFSGAGIPLTDIVGMKLRRSDSRTLIDCRIMSVQGSAPIPLRLLETAHLSGVDVTTVTIAYIDAHKSGKKFSFEELADANRSDRLAEVLGYKR